MTPVALKISGLRFTYPARRHQPAHEVLRGIDLTIQQGQAVAMLGPNGSGKSTLFRLICGTLPPPGAGSIEVFGSRNNQEVRTSLGVVFQTESLDRHMTVWENLRDQALLYGLNLQTARSRIDEHLRQADLTEKRSALVKSLSKGLARRVDLIRAMIHLPRLLILDEPTVGLDPAARERFLEQLERQRRQQQLTVLLSTHLIDEADRHERVLLMHEGRIVADDTPANLRRRAGVRRVTVLDPAWRPPQHTQENWRRSPTGAGWTLALEHDGDQARQTAARLADAGVPFTIAPPTLADVFEQLTGAVLDRAGVVANQSEREAA